MVIVMGTQLYLLKNIATVLVANLAFACFAAAQLNLAGGPSLEHSKSAPKPRVSELAHDWAPPDVDDKVPPTDASLECPLARVLKSAGERAEELVYSLPKFAATEHMEHYQADKAGRWGRPHIVKFNYLVEMDKARNGMLVMNETRDGGHALYKFPAHLATLGLPAIAMVFHPYFGGEYDFQCEGMGKVDGFQAWQIHFQQRPDKFPRLRAYRVGRMSFPLKLKGRAWIDAETFQIVRIETDLVEPIPQIDLKREHLTVDYRPVTFRKKNEELWLQKSAEVFMDFRGHRYRRLHEFTNFLLFSVDVGESVKLPTGSQP